MTNNYYNLDDTASPRTGVRSAQVNDVNHAVIAAFDKLPPPEALQGGAQGFGAATSAAGAYAVTITGWPTGDPQNGQTVRLLLDANNPGGGETLAVNGGTAKPIRDAAGNELEADVLLAGSVAELVYRTNAWQWMGAATGTGGGTTNIYQISADSEVIRPEDYSLGSDALNIAAAIAAGMSSGTPVRLDGNYTLSAALSTFTFSGSEKLTVLGAGTITIDTDFSTPVFTFHATYPTATSVSSITQTTRTFPGGSVATNCTKITSASHGCSVGDIIKIVSDDTIVPTPTATHRMGEFRYVADVSGNDLYVAGYLLNAYATTIRVAKINTAPKLVWDGPTFKATAAQSGWDTACMRVRGFFQPRIRTGCQDGYDFLLELSSCFQAEVDVTLRNMRNRVTTEGVSGYGVQDMASYQSRVTIRGVDCRHCYTSNTPTSTTADELYMYGQTVGAVVTGSVVGSSAAAFDAHSEGVDLTFVDCVTTAARFGEDSSGGGFGLRGTRTRVINCIDRESANGAQFYAQSAGDSTDCELINFGYIGSGQPIRINELSVTELATRPKVRGGYVRTSHATVAGVAAYYCAGGVIDGLIIAPNGSANGLTGIALGGHAEVVVRNLLIDLSGYTGTQFRAFGFAASSTANSLVVESARVIGASGKFQSWFHGQSTSGSSAVLGNLKSDAAPTTFYQGEGSLDLFQLSDGWQEIASWTYATDVANVDFTGLAYDEVRVVARGVTKSASVVLNLRVSITNGSSFKTTSGDYVAIAADGQESNLTMIPMHDTNATAVRSGMITMSGLRSSGKKVALANNRGITNTIETASVVNAIRILPSSGNLTGGAIYVYGR